MNYNRRKFLRNTGILAGSAVIKFPGYDTYSPQNQEKDRLVLLGTQGGPAIRSYRNTPSSSLLVHNSVPLVVDTGYGTTFKLIESGTALSSLKYIFITHHHSDHNLDLGPLVYNSWIAGLNHPLHVYGPVGLKELVDFYWQSNRFDIDTRISDEGREDIRKLIFTHEYTEGEIFSGEGISVSALRNLHPPIRESYSLKFAWDNKLVVFSGDTAYFPPLASFARGADYLLHEIIYGPGIAALVKGRPNAEKLKASILSHHTEVEDVGRLASEAGVKNLVLHHFVPPLASNTESTWTDPIRKHFKGNIILGTDLMEMTL